MFLLNSRAPLVIAPCNRTYTDTIAGILYTKGTGLICRVPLARLNPHTLGFSPRGTSVGSRYGRPESFQFAFSWILGNQLDKRTPAILTFNLVLAITALPRFIRINTHDGKCQLSRKCQQIDLCCHAYLNGNGILTIFPFP